MIFKTVVTLLLLVLCVLAQEEIASSFSSENYKIRYAHEIIGSHPVVSQHFIQGTKIIPQIRIDSIDGSSTVGWNVILVATVNGVEIYTSQLNWEQQTNTYISNNIIDTSSLRGRLSFKYTLQASQEDSFTQTESFTVGYGLNIVEEAIRDKTRISRNNNVGLGTEFNFAVTLFNETHNSFTEGSLSMVVADASSLKLHEDVKESSESGKYEFSFTLDKDTFQGLVGGPLFFTFDARDEKGSHSRDTIYFKYPVQMVASEITIEGGSSDAIPTFEIGQEILVTMKPGSTPDFPNVRLHEAVASRSYFVDVHSETGGNVWSVKGEADAVGSIQFRWIIPKTLDSHGLGLISFRFVGNSGESIQLLNYDSENNDLFDENTVAYKVNSVFELQEFLHPDENDFYYGNTISLKFRIRDTVAGSLLSNGRASKAFLYLTQTDGTTEFVSTKKEAVSNDEDEFEIDWSINVNSIPGKGKVSIVVAELDGDVKINFGQSFDVNIGGTIETNNQAFITSTAVSAETAFLAEFTLSCRDKILISPQLRCVVPYSNGKSAFTDILKLKVASNNDGKASVSWTQPHSNSPSGKYRLSFYRENSQTENQEALFTIDLTHTLGRTTEPLIRFEWLLFIGSVVSFILLEFKRRKYLKA